MNKLIVATLCLAGLLAAQDSAAKKKLRPKVVIGAKAGANFQQITSGGTRATFNETYKPGVIGGVFLGVDRKKSGFRGEALVKTCTFVQHNSGIKLNTVSVDVPFMYEHKLFKRVWLQVGPQMSMLVKAKQTNGVEFKNSMRNVDVSAVAGFHVILPVKLTFDARYVHGFVNINNSNLGGKWHNRALQFTVGYRFLN